MAQANAAMSALDIVRAGFCPICMRGPFVVPAGHAAKAHDLTGRQFRDLVGVTLHERICADSHGERQSEQARERLSHPGVLDKMREGRAKGKGLEWTQEGLRRQQEKARRNVQGLRRLAVDPAVRAKRASSYSQTAGKKRDALVLRYRELGGGTDAVRELARERGTTYGSTRDALKRAGVDVPARPLTAPTPAAHAAIKRKWTKEAAELAVRVADLGGDWAAVRRAAQERGVSTFDVSRRLARNGYPVPPSPRLATPGATP